MLTAVIHGDDHGVWATIDEAPTYSAVADGDALDLMALVQEAIDQDALDLHDDDLRWRYCGDRSGRAIALVRGINRRVSMSTPMPRCYGKCAHSSVTKS